MLNPYFAHNVYNVLNTTGVRELHVVCTFARAHVFAVNCQIQ